MRDYQRLQVYQRALQLAVRVHQFRIANKRVPGLSAQLKRACQSIPTNIAEGCDRPPAEYAARLRIAISESREAEHHLRFAVEMNAIVFGDHAWAAAELVEIRKMLFGLVRFLRSKSPR